MNSNTQHGRQHPPQQAAPPTDPRTDPRTRNPPAAAPATSGDSQGGICRDFIWGICSMGAQCKYRHELEYDAMKAVLKFCHDHQNRTGCTRPDCTYLHTSREEENLFLTTGQIPRVLIDRYTGATTAPVPVTPATSENVQNVPAHTAMYEYIAQPPPPPPPPPATVGSVGPMQPSMIMMQSSMPGPMLSPMQGPLQSSMQSPAPGPIQNPMQGPMPGQMQGPMLGQMQGPMQNLMQGPMQGPMQGLMQGPMQGPMTGPMQGHMTGPMQSQMTGLMQSPIQGPMPVPAPMPPPPPPPPPTSSISSIRMVGPIYSSTMPMQQNMAVVYHPTISQQSSLPPMFDPSRPPPPIPPTTSRILKRPAEECEAGPSKLRKSESSNDSSCESCVQRLIRMELYNHQIEQLQQENEQARAELNTKMEDYEKKKLVLKSVSSADMFRRVEDYIENGSPSPFSHWNDTFSAPPSNLFTAPLASVSNANNSMIHQLADLLMGNSSRTLIPEPVPSTSAPDDTSTRLQVLTTLLDLLRNVPAERSAIAASEEPSRAAAASSNGYNRFSSEGASPPASAHGRPYADSLSSGAGSRPFPEAGPASAPARPYDAAANALAYGDGAAPPRYAPLQAPPRQYHPGACEGAAVLPGAPPLYLPAAYAAPPQPLPPPARPFYGQFAANNVSNSPYPGVVMTQPRPPMPPQNAQNNPYFMGGRYPNHHYYPPYQ